MLVLVNSFHTFVPVLVWGLSDTPDASQIWWGVSLTLLVLSGFSEDFNLHS